MRSEVGPFPNERRPYKKRKFRQRHGRREKDVKEVAVDQPSTAVWNNSPLTALGRNQPYQHLHLRLLRDREKKDTQSVALCYDRPRKLIRHVR